MFFSTWETYHTHTLYLGYFNAPTEGLLIGTLMLAAAGCWGPEVYSIPVANLLGLSDIFGDCSINDLWVLIMFGSFMVGHLPVCVYNVVQARKRMGLPVGPLFSEWAQILVFTFSCMAWLYSPYSTLLSENRLVLFSITMSFVFGRLTTKIILAHLTRQPFPYFTILVIPLVPGALLANLPRFGLPMVSASLELWYLRVYFIFALVAYMHWAFFVINRITTFLDINCLTIKRDKRKAWETVYRQPETGRLESINESGTSVDLLKRN